ncbi:MAG: RDD family protein [Elusimicrobia bacterium]|nr:RDD family protein [Elusimicrobiota bacterium]
MDDLTLLPSIPQAVEPERADVWVRVGAFCADLLLINLGLYMLQWLAWEVSSADDDPMRWVALVGIPLYFTVTTLRYSQTPGQRLAGISIRRRDDQPFTLAGGLLRTVLFLLSLPLSPVNLVIMLVSKQGRPLHDLACKTRAEEIPDADPRGRALCRAACALLLAFFCLRVGVTWADMLESALVLDFKEIAAGTEKTP